MQDLYSSEAIAGTPIVNVGVRPMYSGRAPLEKNASRETERLLYQLVCDEADMAVLGQRMSFLGACMESLRSSLASWVQSNPGAPDSVWTHSVSEVTKGQNLFSFRASDNLATCMRSMDRFEFMGARCVHMKLIWELQSFFHGRIPKEGMSPEWNEAMILCLLAFSAIIVRVCASDEDCEVNNRTVQGISIAPSDNKQAICISLSVPFEPQSFQISVKLEFLQDRDVKITALLAGEGTFC